ncbi:hypothetical protein VTJ04DRAFT_10020 [Mycothermus thermophilus]|uniref:uncharacterized protein n=1 Tax=Humicola insolens TaxID=85995 RepID=UPI00374335CA
MSSHSTLAAAADDRKARLAKLKSLKRKQPSEEQEPTFSSEPTAPAPPSPTAADDQHLSADTNDAAASPTQPPTQDVARLHLSGRNYDFETKGPKLGFEAPPTLNIEGPTLEEKAAEIERKAKEEAAAVEPTDKTIDLTTLRPKKPNWDLKRDLDRKMEILNVRTENAIARLVRERLAEKKKASASSAAADRKDGGDAEADGMLDGAAMVEGMRMREREEEEENRREREAEDAEFGMA